MGIGGERVKGGALPLLKKFLISSKNDAFFAKFSLFLRCIQSIGGGRPPPPPLNLPLGTSAAKSTVEQRFPEPLLYEFTEEAPGPKREREKDKQRERRGDEESRESEE